MRLINTKTLELVEVWSDQVPTYAILSHRWTNEEVKFAEFAKAKESTKAKAGWQKIAACASQSLKDGHQFLWVDTCCIDSTSSAELSEAINSMYRWYQNSAVCYVYLNDVKQATAFTRGQDGRTAFGKSQWHTRGWTLQELLAPPVVRFFSEEWKELAEPRDPELRTHLSHATGISIDVLTGESDVQMTSIARRMSWASHRRTTRLEDMAYCLLGIFNVNMPMLYGEGHKAFRRLQDEIMKTSDDHTLFAWVHVRNDPQYGGLLAPQPRNFWRSANFDDKSSLGELRGPASMVKLDRIVLHSFLSEEPPARPSSTDSTDLKGQGTRNTPPPEFYRVMLKCTERNDANLFPALRLVRSGDGFLRCKELRLRQQRLAGVQKDLLIRHEPAPRTVKKLEQECVRIKFETNCSSAYCVATPKVRHATPPGVQFDADREDVASPPVYKRQEDFPGAHIWGEDGRFWAGKGEVPLRPLKGPEKSNAGHSGVCFAARLEALKWGLPALPSRRIASMRIIYCAKSLPVCIGTDWRGAIGFTLPNGPQGGGGGWDRRDRHEPSTAPAFIDDDYRLFFRRTEFEERTEAGEIAELVLSLRHSRAAGDENTDTLVLGPDSAQCPCTTKTSGSMEWLKSQLM